MTPTDTIREALRRCPVLDENAHPLALESIKDGPDYYAYLHHSHEGDREIDCTPREARNAMTAAWVEALLDRCVMLGKRDDGTGAAIRLVGESIMRPVVIEADTLLHALAAAVCAVMPEPKKEKAT